MAKIVLIKDTRPQAKVLLEAPLSKLTCNRDIKLLTGLVSNHYELNIHL